MQRESISFDILNPSNALLEQLSTILNSFTQIENITYSNEKTVLKDFKNSMQDVKKLKNGDNNILYNGSLDDMLKELK